MTSRRRDVAVARDRLGTLALDLDARGAEHFQRRAGGAAAPPAQ
jgi:hypothetical protein